MVVNRNNEENPPTTVSDHTAKKEESLFLVHNGLLVKSLPFFPSLGMNTIASGWTKPKIKALKLAIQELVVRNPILSGIVVFKDDAIYIQSGAFNPNASHCFWANISGEQSNVVTKSLKDYSALEKRNFIELNIAPLLPNKLETIAEAAKRKLPLFQVLLMELPDEHLFYSFQVSHAIGDAATYYNLLNQLSFIMRGEAEDNMPKIDWHAPSRKTQELFLDHMSQRDVNRVYGVPFTLGLLPRLLRGIKRHSYIFLSRAKINLKKQDLKISHEKYLTTNDIIVAALCQANQRTELMIQITNVRGKVKGLDALDGGNLLQEIPFPREAALDPNNVRKISRERKYYDTNKIPILPSLLGRRGVFSNWSSVQKSLQVEGTMSVIEMPPPEFVSSFPFDTAIIFSMDEDHIGILHNYKKIVTTSGLIRDIIA